MLYQILSFVLDIAFGLLAGACLLRLYMQFQRIPFGNPLGRFVFALSDWLVLPLRRVIPALGRWDTASLLGAWLLKLVQYGLLLSLLGGAASFVLWPLLALVGLVQLAISVLTVLLIVHVVQSWLPAVSPVSSLIDRLCEPLLRPLRRIIPLVGGIDLSPLALLVLLQVVAIVLASLQHPLLR